MSSALFIPGGGPVATGGTQPSLSVVDRTDGEAYTVTDGEARSLSISAAAGATLSTTVELASSGLPVSVTGAATDAPSWTAPAGSTDGEAYQVLVVATLDGLTSSVAFTERVAGVAPVEPSLSVASRVDGEAYTVTAGDARSLTITAAAGATLSTTVETATGAVVSVSGASTASPSWTVPTGGTAGEAYQVLVVATLDGLTSSVAFTERIAGSGGGGISEWSQVASTDYTTTSTGSLSSGSAVIDGITYDVTVAAGDSITDDSNGIRFSQTGAGFNYVGTDINNLVTTIAAPFRVAFAFGNLSLSANGTAGVAIYSNTTPDAPIDAPSFQLRLVNSSGTYSMQLLRTSGATGASSSFTVAGSTVLASAPTSMVIELYVVGPVVFAAYTLGTTVISSPATLATVTGTPATYAQMSGATGGYNFTSPAWWPYAWATAVIGSGPGATITADVLAIDVQELV